MRRQKINGKRWAVLGSAGLAPLSPADDHVNLSAAALGTDKPLAPIENGGVRAVSLRHPGRVGLNLMLTGFAPDDQPDLSGSGSAEGHRGATIGLQLRRRLLAAVAHGGVYPFGAGKGSRSGSGLSFARIAFRVRMRGENW